MRPVLFASFATAPTLENVYRRSPSQNFVVAAHLTQLAIVVPPVLILRVLSAASSRAMRRLLYYALRYFYPPRHTHFNALSQMCQSCLASVEVNKAC